MKRKRGMGKALPRAAMSRAAHSRRGWQQHLHRITTTKASTTTNPERTGAREMRNVKRYYRDENIEKGTEKKYWAVNRKIGFWKSANLFIRFDFSVSNSVMRWTQINGPRCYTSLRRFFFFPATGYRLASPLRRDRSPSWSESFSPKIFEIPWPRSRGPSSGRSACFNWIAPNGTENIFQFSHFAFCGLNFSKESVRSTRQPSASRTRPLSGFPWTKKEKKRSGISF